MPPIPLQLRTLLAARSGEPISTTQPTEAIDTPPPTTANSATTTTPSLHASSPAPTPSTTPTTALIITVIILSVLVAFSLLYLSRLLWTRYVLPKRERRRSRRLLAEKKKAWEGMAVYFDDSAASAARRGSVDATDPEKAGPKKSPHGAKKARTFSDDLWSAKMDDDEETSSSSSSSSDGSASANESDDDERDPLRKGRGSPYKSWRPAATSSHPAATTATTTTAMSSSPTAAPAIAPPSTGSTARTATQHGNSNKRSESPAVPQPPRQAPQQQYGIARGSGLGLPPTSSSSSSPGGGAFTFPRTGGPGTLQPPPPVNPFALTARRRRHTNTSLSSVATGGTTSSSILYSPLVNSDGDNGGEAGGERSPFLRQAGTAAVVVAGRGVVVGVGPGKWEQRGRGVAKVGANKGPTPNVGSGKRRSVRFMSLGSGERAVGPRTELVLGPASNDPLRMNPVGKGDLVDVPLVEVDMPLMGKQGERGNSEEDKENLGLGIKRGMAVGRESWPLRTWAGS